jgi:hypothetical protein
MDDLIENSVAIEQASKSRNINFLYAFGNGSFGAYKKPLEGIYLDNCKLIWERQ